MITVVSHSYPLIAKHITRKDSVAIKREDSSTDLPQLADEYKLLKMFEGHGK